MVYFRCAAVLALLLGTGSNVLFPQNGKGKGTHNLKLTSQRSGGAIAELKGSFLYTGDLSNESDAPVDVEAVQMPGGYAGEGRFFACSLQTWNGNDHRWVLRRRASLSEFGKSPNPITIKVKPGDHAEVCRIILPAQADTTAPGDCARFLFQTRWNGTASVRVYSNTFIIGRPASSNDRSCATSDHSTSSLLHESGHVLDPPKQQ
jgi:hypothetical protein